MVKITNLQIENVKKVKAVALEPAENGLTIIGGRNGQGKTSVLDAITWALAGDKYRPSQAQRMDSVLPPNIRVQLSNGVVVERKGKNSGLKVISPDGSIAGQKLLDSFISAFALDVPRFMASSDKEKANIMLDTLGLKEEVLRLSEEESRLYNERHMVGRICDQKRKYADEITDYPDAPKVPVSTTELMARYQTLLAQNGENQRKREQLNGITAKKNLLSDRLQVLEERIEELERQKAESLDEYNKTVQDEKTARKTVAELQDESTQEIEESIRNIEIINNKVRANCEKERAEEEAEQYAAQYNDLTNRIEAVRQRKTELINDAGSMLPGLTVEAGELRLNGCSWDCMAASEQLKAATAIVRRLNPECGFVLMDKLEQMDVDTLKDFGSWLEQNSLQMIATRVSTGDECSLIIEDGMAATGTENVTKKWVKGEF